MRKPAAVTVRAMSEAEFAAWQPHAIQSYAEDISRASGDALAATLARARSQLTQLLPDGLASEGVWLLTIVDESDTPVGVLWIAPVLDRPGSAFVYDIEIAEEHRGRGLGRAAMLAAERTVSAAGFDSIGLSVFGYNTKARNLYDSLGYEVVATQMIKSLSTGER